MRVIRYIKDHPGAFFGIFLVCYLILMISQLNRYSEAWDNVWMYQYGKQTAQIFSNPFQHYFEYEYGPADLRYFGPFLVTAAYFISRVTAPILPFWSPLDIFRLCYFLVYLAGILSFYHLSKRYLSPWASVGAGLLLIFQPLLFGHAPVSPKDTTFFGMVIMAIYLGLKMVDNLPTDDQPPILPTTKLPAVFGLFAGFSLLTLFRKQIITTVLAWVVSTGENGFPGQIFFRYAADFSANRLEGYITRLSDITLTTAILITTLLFVVIITPRKTLEIIKRTAAGFGGKYVILAGILFGLSISVRILGLLIGGIILAVLCFTKPIRNWFYSGTAYALTTAATIYLTWPYLWRQPISRFLAALQVNLGHQHNPPVLFNGIQYSASDLPMSYVPTLIGVQFTIPVLLLAIIGLALLIFRSKHQRTQFIIIIAIWFILPVAAFMAFRPALHDNIRHILFILPPLFLLAGLALDALGAWMKGRQIVMIGLFLTCLLPGIVHIIQYQPYEYIYYNQLAGGTAKGADLYGTDYLALSLSEAVEYVNQTAAPGSTIYVIGPYNIARNIIREDLVLIDRQDSPLARLDLPDTYLITYKKPNENKDGKLVTLYQVTADKLPLGGVYIYQSEE